MILKRILELLVVLVILFSNSNAQLKLEASTNKTEYDYGETIYLSCAVINDSDSTISFFSSTTSSCQAEFEFNDYYSGHWTFCLPLYEKIEIAPHSSRVYSWTIDPKKEGILNRKGTQTIIAHYFKDELRDTIYINAPMLLGGQLKVNFEKSKESIVTNLKDSLDVEVLERSEFPNISNVDEIWQIMGIQIDSIYKHLQNDERFNNVSYNRMMMYDSITVTSVENKNKIVEDFYLSNAYPNPFNPVTRIEYFVPYKSKVKIVAFDILGNKVIQLVDEVKQRGKYQAKFNAANKASGIYFIRMETDKFFTTKKVILLK